MRIALSSYYLYPLSAVLKIYYNELVDKAAVTLSELNNRFEAPHKKKCQREMRMVIVEKWDRTQK